MIVVDSTDADSKRQTYTLKVLTELFTLAKLNGIKPEDMLEFFSTQIETMLNYPPNVSKGSDTAGRIWVLRGFYPNSPIFFKLVLIETTKATNYTSMPFFAKASPLRIKSKYKGGGEAFINFNGNKLNENLTNRMENVFFDAQHKVDDLIEEKITMPRCMSPKGMKLFRFKKPGKVRSSCNK